MVGISSTIGGNDSYTKTSYIDIPSSYIDLHSYCLHYCKFRFCLYPQEIILQLDQAARIRMVQLLSHNSMIASKVEFFISTKYRPNDHTTFTRLGYVSFSDNQSSNYKVRTR